MSLMSVYKLCVCTSGGDAHSDTDTLGVNSHSCMPVCADAKCLCGQVCNICMMVWACLCRHICTSIDVFI